ncbi:hypothetical protein SAY87_031911 [Trapa incisa]|uniref:Uncharacterized protein n=1 Tax=Trapa incisa TaxID=236973 RepID=A0AAN7QLJ4_9MYRT|nr:hypothetical protein SAY87_031911 [Trapa incisa]
MNIVGGKGRAGPGDLKHSYPPCHEKGQLEHQAREKLYLYQGFDPESINLPRNKLNFDAPEFSIRGMQNFTPFGKWFVSPRKLSYCELKHADRFSSTRDQQESCIREREEIIRKISNIMKHRVHPDGIIKMMGVLLFGPQEPLLF